MSLAVFPSRALFAALAALAALSATPCALGQTDPPPTSVDDTESSPSRAALPTVTVSASQRDPRLDNLNGSASAADRTQLDDAQAVRTTDLGRVFPELLIQDSGTQLLPMITLRNLVSAQDFYNPALAVYVDGVPQLPVFTVQSLVDVESIELLKGPQGTLYGRSARGGVLDIGTHQPDDAFQTTVRAGLSSRSGYQAQVNVSGPLAPGLLYGAASLASSYTPGELHSPVLGDHLGGARSPVGNFKLRLAPAGNPWDVGLTGARDCVNGQQAYVRYQDIGTHTAYATDSLPDEFRRTRERLCVTSWAARGQRRWDDWQLSAIVSTQRLSLEREFAFGEQYLRQPENWRQNTQELRLSTYRAKRRAAGDWDAVFGLFRQQINQSRSYAIDIVTPDLAPLLSAYSRNHSASVAAYGDLTWQITSQADVSVGLRLSRDSAATRFSGELLGDAFAGAPSTRQRTGLGRIGAGYQFSGPWRGYVNIAQGYKPAGYALAPASANDAEGYGRERSTSYEAGLRYTERDLRLHLAAYRIDTRDAQLYGDNPFNAQTLHNMGDTRANGLEFSARWALVRHWALQASGFVTSVKYRRYAGAGDCGNCNGSPPARGLALALDGRVRAGNATWRPRIAVRGIGPHYFDTANTLRQGGYTLIDLGLAFNLNSVEWAFYLNNLANKAYRTYGFAYGAAGNFALPGQGRVFGVTLTWAY